jgi:hypothetical protein
MPNTVATRFAIILRSYKENRLTLRGESEGRTLASRGRNVPRRTLATLATLALVLREWSGSFIPHLLRTI